LLLLTEEVCCRPRARGPVEYSPLADTTISNAFPLIGQSTRYW